MTTMRGSLPAMMVRYFVSKPMIDSGLLLAVMLLSAIGLVVLYSASDAHFQSVVKQAVRLGVGFLALLVIARVPPQILRSWTPHLYAVCVLMLIAVAVAGEGRGAQRWLDLGFVRFQPSELMKLAVPMMLAWFFHRRALPPRPTEVFIATVLIGVPALLILRQPDLGTALLVGVSGVFVLFLAGLSWRWVLGMFAAAAVAAPLMWQFVMHEYQKQRVLMLFNPEADPLGKGWNIIQSKIAVGSGGFLGKGWQSGSQAHLDFLPERSTDFILAVFAEEFGLLGVLALLLIYLYIIARCLVIAAQAKDSYSRLLAGSLGLTFFVYVLVNCGMISGLLPVVGIPLPLVSYGGTSLVTLLAGFGIVMSVHSHRRFLREPR